MPEQMPFIGRRYAIKRIEEFITEQETRRAVFIHGKGGVGKTRLLEVVHAACSQNNKEPPLLAVDIIDFDDRTLQVPENVLRKIARLLNKNAFDTYLRKMLDLRKMKMADVSRETLEEQSENVFQTFMAGFNEISSAQRVILFLDTTDILRVESDLWQTIVSVITAAQNTVFLLAGRNAKKLHNALQPTLPDDTHLIHLNPLTKRDSRQYLKQKQERLHIAMEPDLAEKLVLLAQGRPILIDLAAEWVSRQIPLEWLVETSLEELQLLSDEEIEKRREEIEAHLVQHITQVRAPMDRLTLAMSYIYPLDAPMIAELLRIPEDEAETLFNDAQSYVFVKPLPDGRLSLHDEMRRMVNSYVWPEVDPEGKRRRRDSQLAANYLEQKVKGLAAQIAELEKELSETAEMQQEAADQLYWSMQMDWVRYALRADWETGIEVFAQVFDLARSYRSEIREFLLNQVAEGLDEAVKQGWHTPDARYQYQIRQARHNLNKHRLEQAYSMLQSLQVEYPQPERQLDLATRLANWARLSGNMQQAVDYLERALAVCQAHPNLMRAWGGNILNSLGWMYRQQGNWQEAEKSYRASIDLIRESGNQAKLANAYNNLGFIVGLNSNYESALRYCHMALKIQESLGLKHNAGRTHNTLGIIYRGKEDFLTALKHTDQAITIFEEFGDDEWLSKAYCERGTTKWHMGALQEADEDLEKSNEYYQKTGKQQDLVNILHRRGHVAWELNRIEEAEKYFKESAKIARQVADYQQIVNSLEGLAELYYHVGYQHHQQNNVKEREQWYAKSEAAATRWKTEYEDKGFYFPIYAGSRVRTLGNIAYDRGDYDTALNYYLNAYPHLATRGGYSRYMLPDALDWLQERIDQLPPQLALEWCDKIQHHWETQGLDKDHPAMISVCDICRDNAKRRAKPQGDAR